MLSVDIKKKKKKSKFSCRVKHLLTVISSLICYKYTIFDGIFKLIRVCIFPFESFKTTEKVHLYDNLNTSCILTLGVKHFGFSVLSMFFFLLFVFYCIILSFFPRLSFSILGICL